jgi:hypothetical protein
MDLREIAPCSFITRFVDVDVNFEPPGTGGYRDLFDEAAHIELAGAVRPLVAAPADLERIARGTVSTAPAAEKPPPVLAPEPDVASWLPGPDDTSWFADDIRAGRTTRI